MYKINFIIRLFFLNLMFLISTSAYSFALDKHIYALDCNQRSSAIGWFGVDENIIAKIVFFNGKFDARLTSSSFLLSPTNLTLIATYSGSTEMYRFKDGQGQLVYRYTSPENYSVKDRKSVGSGADVPILKKCSVGSVAYEMVNDANDSFIISVQQNTQTNKSPNPNQVLVQSTNSTQVENYIASLRSWQRHYCVSSHVRKLSAPIKEKIGEKFKTNPNNIEIKRFNLSFDECLITAYTDKGPFTCQLLFDKDGNGKLNICPFTEVEGAREASYRFSLIGIEWGMSQALRNPPQYNDVFKGTGREGGL